MSWARGLRLVCRADATAAVGAGHAIRLATLGEAWAAAGGEVTFAGELALPFVRCRVERLGFRVESRAPAEADLLVVDSYDLAVRQPSPGAAVNVLVDDLGGMVPAGFDAVWNPSAYPAGARYPEFAGPVITGPDSIAIRADLPTWHQNGQTEIVVTLGGGTPPEPIQEALARLSPSSGAESFGITGSWAPPGWRSIPPDELWCAAERARVLVTAAGTTVWEAATFGIPAVVLRTAENQRFVYRWAREAGVPGLDTRRAEPDTLARRLAATLPAARALPPLTNGAPRVAERLARLVRDRGGS
jgi:hypothetical protein